MTRRGRRPARIDAAVSLRSALRICPISTRVNKPENDDPTTLDEIVLGAEAAE
jgi:hypothetical protein